ncbi:MAG: hypothetical protein IKD90_09635 [Clostridiales bacterium]|nr:hypothetical protein [Clostridiales bacterium]
MSIRISELIGEIVASLLILAFIIGGIVLWFYEYNATSNEPILPIRGESVVEAQVDISGN